jgi:hypothetical protein
MATTPDPASSAAPENDRSQDSKSRVESPEEASAALHERLDEFVDYAVYYLLTRLDALKFAIKRRILSASIVLIAVLAAAGIIVTAVVLLCEGICDALTDLLGHRWAGELVTGVLFLATVGILGSIAVKRLISGPHQRTVLQYEELRRRQRARYGRDVNQRAREDDGHG